MTQGVGHGYGGWYGGAHGRDAELPMYHAGLEEEWGSGNERQKHGGGNNAGEMGRGMTGKVDAGDSNKEMLRMQVRRTSENMGGHVAYTIPLSATASRLPVAGSVTFINNCAMNTNGCTPCCRSVTYM